MWKKCHNQGKFDYSVLNLIENNSGMEALRLMFKTGQADGMNLVLFSTGGVHGDYATIEDIEEAIQAGFQPEDEDVLRELTFLIIQPRVLSFRYGVCRPQTPEDIAWLKNLRASSKEIISCIGEKR